MGQATNIVSLEPQMSTPFKIQCAHFLASR